MKRIPAICILISLVFPLPAADPGTSLGEIILSLPGSRTAFPPLPDRLTTMPQDLFPDSTGFRHETIPGIQPLDPARPAAGLWYWVPREWVDTTAGQISRETALEAGKTAGAALLVYSNPRFSGLATDMNEIIQQTLLVSLAYRESGYDTRLLATLYMTFQSAWLQTLPAFHAALNAAPGMTPALLQSTFSGTIDPARLATPPAPATRLAAINAQLYTSLKLISRALLTERPGSISAWKCLSMLARSRNETSLLLESLRSLERLEPESAQHSINLAETLCEANQSDCTNAAARALKKDPRLASRVDAVRHSLDLRTRIRAVTPTTAPQAWQTLADQLSSAGLERELDALLAAAPAALRQSRSWQLHNLNRKGEILLTKFSREILALLMRPSVIPEHLAAQRTGIQDWFAAAQSATRLHPGDAAIFGHLVFSGLLASITENLEGRDTSWNALKQALQSRPADTGVETLVSRIILKHFPGFMAIMKAKETVSLFDAGADNETRKKTLLSVLVFSRNLVSDLAGLDLARRYPDSSPALVAGRILASLKGLLHSPLDQAALLGFLDGSRDFSPLGDTAEDGIRTLRAGLESLLAAGTSSRVNNELALVRRSLAGILEVAAGFASLPAGAEKNIFSTPLPASLSGHVRHLLTHNLHSPAAVSWLQAAVHISRVRTHFDEAACTRAVHLLLDALDRLEQPSDLPDGVILRLYYDTRQLGEVILQNLGYCLAELRHRDAAVFTGSSLRKSTNPAEHISLLLDHRRVVHEYRQASLVRELRQILEMLPGQAHMAEKDRQVWAWAVLSRLVPLAGSDAPALRNRLQQLGLDNPLRPSSFSFGSAYGTRTGFVIYSQVTIQAFSTPETWLRP